MTGSRPPRPKFCPRGGTRYWLPIERLLACWISKHITLPPYRPIPRQDLVAYESQIPLLCYHERAGPRHAISLELLWQVLQEHVDAADPSGPRRLLLRCTGSYASTMFSLRSSPNLDGSTALSPRSAEVLYRDLQVVPRYVEQGEVPRLACLDGRLTVLMDVS